MAKQPTKVELEDRRRALLQIGTGLLTAGGLLGLTVYLIQRQAHRGDFLQVRMTHTIDEETRGLLARYTPIMEKISNDGVRVRFWGRGSGNTSYSTD